MMHIRISGENGAGIPIPPKTISEVEEMAEFKEMKNLEELIEYMHRLTANKNKEYYLYTWSYVWEVDMEEKSQVEWIFN